MWEQLSYEPFPGIFAGTQDVMTQIRHHYADEEKLIRECGITRVKLNEMVCASIMKDDPQCSNAGRLFHGINHYASSVLDFLIKRKKARKKIKAFIKTTAWLYLIFRDGLEKRYKPGGIFETEMSLIWNPILQSGDYSSSTWRVVGSVSWVWIIFRLL